MHFKSLNHENLVDQAKTMFKELDPTNDLTFLRIRTKVILSMFGPHSILPKYTLILTLFQKHEIMVAPDRDYLLIVIQNTQDA